MNRQRITLLFIGIIAALAGSATTTYLRVNHCEEAGGSWDFRKRGCAVQAGKPPVPQQPSESAIGLGITLAMGFMLYRATTFRARKVTSRE